MSISTCPWCDGGRSLSSPTAATIEAESGNPKTSINARQKGRYFYPMILVLKYVRDEKRSNWLASIISAPKSPR